MTDLEMTKLCAEAMNLSFAVYKGREVRASDQGIYLYNPLHDDAQAMALVKKLGLCAMYPPDYAGDVWFVESRDMKINAESKYLNRAIVECVAKMQAAK